MTYPQFPKGFYFGTATAAYQIEGGGLIHVDHQTQKRIFKDSGYWYRNLIQNLVVV